MKLKDFTRLLPTVPVFLAASLSGSFAQHKVLLEPIAEQGETANGTGGSTYDSASSVFINGTDRAIVTASIAGAPSTSNTGVWTGAAGALTLLAREGNAAPTSGGTFNALTPLAISAAGEGALRSTLLASGEGYWSGIGGGTNYVAALGQPAPGTVDNFALMSAGMSGNGAGRFAFSCRLSGATTTDRTVYSNLSGSLALLLREGTAVPGVVGSPVILDAAGDFIVLANSGYMAMQANYQGGIYTGVSAGGLLLRNPGTGNFSIMVNKNDPAPGSPSPFSDFQGLAMNEGLDTLFAATLRQINGVTANDNQGVWRRSPAGVISLVARENAPAPGTLPGVVFSAFQEMFIANTGVQILVVTLEDPVNGTVTLANDRAIYGDFGSGLVLLAREGETVLNGEDANPAGTIGTIEVVQMNLDGDLLMQARLQTSAGPPTVTISNDLGVWTRANLAGSNFKQVIREGQEVYDSTLASVNVITLALSKQFAFNIGQGNGPVGRLRSLNETEDSVALTVTHTGGRGAYFIRRVNPLQAVAIGRMTAHDVAAADIYQTIRPGAVINNDDRVAFRAYMALGTGDVNSANYQGIWAMETGPALPVIGPIPPIELVIRASEPVPGIEGGTFASITQNPAWNDQEKVAFHGILGTGGAINLNNRWGLWYGDKASLGLVARAGTTTIPNLTPPNDPPNDPAMIQTFNGMPAVNNAGNIVSRLTVATTTGSPIGPITIANNSAVVKFTPTPSTLAQEGAPAPGTAVNFAELAAGNLPVFLNNSEIAAFQATVAGGDSGIWMHDGTTLSKYVLTGDPGDGSATILHPSSVALSDSGAIAFSTTLGGSAIVGVDDVAIFSGPYSGAPSLVARTGMAQSTGKGPAGIDPAAQFLTLTSPTQNTVGHGIFVGDLVPGLGGVDATNNSGIWKFNGTTKSLVVRKGQFAPNEDGDPTGNVFDSFGTPSGGNPVIGVLDRMAFTARLRVDEVNVTADNDTGLWVVNSVGAISEIIREGDVITVPHAALGSRLVTIKNIELATFDAGIPSQQKTVANFHMVCTLVFQDGTSGAFLVELF